MQVRLDRHARDFMAQLGKFHTPRKVCRLAPATSGGEASLSSKEVANSDSRRTRVRSFPPRQLVTLHQQVPGKHGAEQATVKDATGTQEVERHKFKRIGAILRFG